MLRGESVRAVIDESYVLDVKVSETAVMLLFYLYFGMAAKARQ